MEEIRRQFTSQPYFIKSGARPPPSTISVSSTDSTPEPPSQNAILEISSGSERDKPTKPTPNGTSKILQQLDSRLMTQPVVVSKTIHTTGKPIHIPSNNDIVQIRPQLEPSPEAVPQGLALDSFINNNLYDPKKTASDAEKDLKDLLQQSFDGREEGEGERMPVDMRDAIVDGFHDNVRLLRHQVYGRKWMAERETGRKSGGILADDMGLGKTIQTLTRIVDGRPRRKDRDDGWDASTLVVAPVSLVSQWASEIKRMTVGTTVLEHHGQSRTTNPGSLKRYHVVVTSYQTVASEYNTFMPEAKDDSKPKKSKKVMGSESDELDESDEADHFGRTLANSKKLATKTKKSKDALFHVKWFRIVLDEAHNIKNRNTKAAIACCALEGKFRWCLTGTPMQNNVEELYSLIKFLGIRPLNDWQTFNEQINKPVKSGRSTRAMKRLHVVLRAIMLRRQKTDMLDGKPLLELPDRTVQIMPCEFDDEERAFYNSLENKIEAAMEKFVKAGDIMKNYTSVLVLLLRLRQACNHPSLVYGGLNKDVDAIDPRVANKDSDGDIDSLADALGGLDVSLGRKCQMCQTELTSENKSKDEKHCDGCYDVARAARHKSAVLDSKLPPDSAKVRKVLYLLKEIQDRQDDSGGPSREKTIIFSQFTSMLDILEIFLKAEGIKFVRYDGSMTKDKREASLNTIKTSSSTTVILISFKAGSTGLNLTACNNVILVDLWWNPALEEQAFDRSHRFGQTRNVNIYKLTIEKTVEERILHLQDQKRALANAALAGDKLKNSRLGVEDLLALFRSGHDDED